MQASMRLKALPAVVGGIYMFQACALAGAVAACALAFRLASDRRLSLWFVALLVPVTAAAQTGLALAVKVCRGGREQLVFYHHAAVFVLTVITAATVASQPIRAWLDVVTPAFFAFQSFGRVGCWAAGCCYGRPSRFGFAYGENHSDALPPDLCGVPLWPVQLAESVVAAACAAAGFAGAPFYTCLAPYAASRFLLEYFRGEPGRGRALGLTEAQWTSAAIVSVVWPLSIPLLLMVALLCRPLPPEHVLQLLRAIACTRIERAEAATSFSVVLKREAGELRVLSPVTSTMTRRVRMLDRLVCQSRNV